MTAAESTAVVVDFPALLDTLGFTDDEFVAIGHDADGEWRTAVKPPVAAPHYVAKLPETANIYFGVNPTRGPTREDATRGKAADVTRLAALWCDLDFKAEGCGSLAVTHAIIDDLSGILGTRPSVLVYTGHGIHPYWAVSDGHIQGGDVGKAALVRRFGRLVANVAKDRGAKVDGVFDLAHAARARHYQQQRPRMSDDNGRSGCESATAYADTGGPLTLAEIDDRLTEFGICESDDDRDRGDAEEISAPGSWQWADRQICRYVAGMVDGWRTDPVNARNPWLYSQGIRLFCAHRYGCFTADGYRDAETALIGRFRALCATQEPRRAVRRYEERDVLYRACKRAAAKTDEQVAAELGQHSLLSHITLEQFVADGAEPDEPEPEPPDENEDGEPPGDEPPKDQPPNDNEAWANAVRQRALQIRLDREARQLVDDESRPPIVYPPIRSLDTLLSEPDNPTQYRIEGVAPAGGRVLLSSQYKAGKTTTVGNAMRSLVDSDPFLGKFTVHQPSQRLVLIDDELSDHTVRLWLREQQIVNTAAVADVITLRGNVAAFNLLDDKCRAHWATRLSDLGCDYLILDCLRPILDALGLDEHHEVGQFLVPFDALLAEAGIPDSLMVQHMGHTNERARGDSRLQDWPDAIWRIVRETEEPDWARFFTAYGRDVNVHEGRLAFDPATRRLTYVAGSRGDAKTEAARGSVIAVLAANAKAGGEPMSVRDIQAALAGEHPRDAIRDAIKQAVKHDLVTVEDGSRRAKLHRISHPCSECGQPVVTGHPRHESCPDPGEGGLYE